MNITNIIMSIVSISKEHDRKRSFLYILYARYIYIKFIFKLVLYY